MQLLKFTVQGFRRFDTKTSINLSDRVVAVVGRNEAGKSSLLAALTRFNNDEPITVRDLSRKSSTEPVMRAFFRLEQADMDAVVHIHGAADVKWATCFKRADGFRQIALDTRPTRDLTPRHSSLEAIVALAGDPVLDNLCAEADYPWEPDRFNRVQQYLQQTDETLPPETLNDIHAFVDSLSRLDPGRNDPDSDPDAVDHEASQRRMDAVAKINALLVHEEEDTPANQVAGILRTRLPEFLLFGEAERNLLGTYDLNAEDGQPVALRNLGALAGLDFDVLKGAINNDVGTAESMVEDANARLKADFEESWGSDIYLRLRTDDAILRVLTRNETGVGYSEWGDRSDGVRAFAALRAFIAGRRDPKPVLLIDEIESHLHYDAQVDLVDVLTEQHLAAKVIYTTHSVGCLPQDLGSGIRAVEPVVDGERECSRLSTHSGVPAPGSPACCSVWAPRFFPTPLLGVAYSPREPLTPCCSPHCCEKPATPKP